MQVWPHSQYPLIRVGKLVFNRNPSNYFADVEQAAFSPDHLVPGIEPSPDKMLQVRRRYVRRKDTCKEDDLELRTKKGMAVFLFIFFSLIV